MCDGVCVCVCTHTYTHTHDIVIDIQCKYQVRRHRSFEIGAVAQAQRYADLGVRHFCAGWDRFMYSAAVARLGEEMNKFVETV